LVVELVLSIALFYLCATVLLTFLNLRMSLVAVERIRENVVSVNELTHQTRVQILHDTPVGVEIADLWYTKQFSTTPNACFC
jgi:hypothetical protein